MAKGQDATFTVDAYPERTFRGKVLEIRNAPITVQNVVTYDVVIQVDNSDLRLKPGMTANVSVQIEHKENILKIPNSALRFRPESAKKEETSNRKQEAPSSDKGGAVLERLAKELSLTADQQSKVEMVLRASKSEFQEIREKSKPEEARIRIRTLMRQKIWGFLTEEQKEKMKEMGQSSKKSRATPGRAWVSTPEGKLIPVEITVGITDGTFSEVVTGNLQEGAEIVVEELMNKKARPSTPSPSTKGLR